MRCKCGWGGLLSHDKLVHAPTHPPPSPGLSPNQLSARVRLPASMCCRWCSCIAASVRLEARRARSHRAPQTNWNRCTLPHPQTRTPCILSVGRSGKPLFPPHASIAAVYRCHISRLHTPTMCNCHVQPRPHAPEMLRRPGDAWCCNHAGVLLLMCACAALFADGLVSR